MAKRPNKKRVGEANPQICMVFFSYGATWSGVAGEVGAGGALGRHIRNSYLPLPGSSDVDDVGTRRHDSNVFQGRERRQIFPVEFDLVGENDFGRCGPRNNFIRSGAVVDLT